MPASHQPSEGDLEIPLPGFALQGQLLVPSRARGVVLFAHGSGSGRHSPRNQLVARSLREHGIATLLFDLLTSAEEREDQFTGHLRFDIDLLARRLLAVTEWYHERADALPVGYFGSSTGGAAALVAAARSAVPVVAIVSRGGRPDLAGSSLPMVTAATLLIVGGEDTAVMSLNQQAYARMRCPRELRLIPGATHLFEEPGALEQVAQMAAEWFARHLPGTARVTKEA